MYIRSCLSIINHKQLSHLEFYSKFNTMNKNSQKLAFAIFLSLCKGKIIIYIYSLCTSGKTLKLLVIGASI